MERTSARVDIFFGPDNNVVKFDPEMVNKGISRMEERRLTERVVSGDMVAFGQLADIHNARLYRNVLRRVGNATVAEDIVAGTLEKALKGISSYEMQGPPFVSWLLRIAHNQTTDHLRAEVGENGERQVLRMHNDVPGPDADQPHNRAEIAEDLGRVKAAISLLKDKQQKAIVLRFFDNMEYLEIAKTLGITVNLARVTVHRGLTALKNQLQDLNSVDLVSEDGVA